MHCHEAFPERNILRENGFFFLNQDRVDHRPLREGPTDLLSPGGAPGGGRAIRKVAGAFFALQEGLRRQEVDCARGILQGGGGSSSQEQSEYFFYFFCIITIKVSIGFDIALGELYTSLHTPPLSAPVTRVFSLKSSDPGTKLTQF